MSKAAMPQYVIYSRKSRFTGKGESIENQIEMCRRYLAMHCGEAAASAALVYEDEGFSGGNLERPQFKKMMKDARQSNFTAIVVYRLDRISRNIGDFAKLIEELNGMGIGFVSVKEQFDTGSPMGRAMMYISSVFSQLERETIAERIRDNMHELAKTGRWLGGNTPTGYTSEHISRVTIDGKKRQACRLKIVPEEIRLVRIIFEKFLEMDSLTRVEAYLLAHRFETKKGNDFPRTSVRSILTNPVYMIADGEALEYLKESGAELFSDERDFDAIHGIMAYNRTLQQPGKANQLRPMEEWIVAVGAHEGVIPGVDWVKVQRMLAQNSAKSYRKPRSNAALLSGLVYCGDCGNYMRPKLTNRRQADGSFVYPYMCTTKEHSGSTRCKMKNINGNLLDRMVEAELKKLAFCKEEFVCRLEHMRKELCRGQTAAEEELELLREKIGSVDLELRKLVSTLYNVSGTAAEPYVVRRIEELHARGEELRSRLNEFQNLRQQDALEGELGRMTRLMSGFGAAIDTMAVEQKRLAVRAVVKKVVWDGERVHLWLLGSEDLLLPGLNEGSNPAAAEKMPLCMDSK